MSILNLKIASIFASGYVKLNRLKDKTTYRLKKALSTRRISRLDSSPIVADLTEIRLFAISRNESKRIPHFLEYYKSMGINRFFILDNNSTDDSIQQLLVEEKVHIFQTRQGYKNHWYWMEHLLELYGLGHWCMVVDIDELFSYPHMNNISLHGLTRYLEKDNKTAVRGILLDMYSNCDLSLANCTVGSNPLGILNYFDCSFQSSPFFFFDRHRWEPFCFEIFTGGMRERVFGTSSPPNILSKVSFFKNLKGTYLAQGMHAINGAEVSDIRSVIFHTKFLSDFIDEVEEECLREQHFGNAFYYKNYKRAISADKTFSFYNQCSVKYQNMEQLLSLGVLKSCPSFEQYVEHNKQVS